METSPDRRLLIVALGLLSTGCPPGGPSCEPLAEVRQVGTESGNGAPQATVERSGETLPLTAGATLTSCDVVVTGPDTWVLAGAGADVTFDVPPGSRVAVSDQTTVQSGGAFASFGAGWNGQRGTFARTQSGPGNAVGTFEGTSCLTQAVGGDATSFLVLVGTVAVSVRPTEVERVHAGEKVIASATRGIRHVEAGPDIAAFTARLNAVEARLAGPAARLVMPAFPPGTACSIARDQLTRDAPYSALHLEVRLAGTEKEQLQATRPRPGAELPAGTQVELTCEGLAVPGVLGLTLGAARERLAAAGLEVGEEVGSRVTGTVAAGLVNDQEPDEGAFLAPGAPVLLTVEDRPTPPVTVPALERVSVDFAQARLARLNLAVGTVDERDPTTGLDRDFLQLLSRARAPMVLEQRPAAGERVPVGSPVDLVAYRQTFPLPDFRRQAYDRVKATWSAMFRLAATTECSDLPAGLVIGQTPAPETQVRPLSTVSLTLAGACDERAPPR